MITIYVNEKEVELKPNTNILQLLQFLNSPLKGIAVAINQNIIPNANWATQRLVNQDQILIIQATQGG
ncbi:sulfur carrier protein ThiS [Wocania ichthyoenteri]|uniref:sulfur carrier protein ThiS n=1 Tax=Wocania ichthyoenteri TaxID=1230531 RepID=UPI00053D00BE|nr:sulfur carrier protein ThiS [Wocania ichthyoenteri]